MPYKDPEKQKEAQRKHYLANKDKFRSRSAKRRALKRQMVRDKAQELGGCKLCSEKDPSCMDFHHLDPSIKVAGINTLVKDLRSDTAIRDEIAKCVVLCANCHRKVHAGVLTLDTNP